MLILCGDFFQIPPVSAASVYTDPNNGGTTSSDTRRNRVLDALGYQLWRSISNVIILKQSMRHGEDERFSQCLKNIRRGMYNAQDIRLLNERVIEQRHVQELQSRFENYQTVPFVVSSNELRQALNWRFLQILSISIGVKPIVCLAEMQSAKGSFTSSDLYTLFTCPENKTSNLAALPPLLPGMPVPVYSKHMCSFGYIKRG